MTQHLNYCRQVVKYFNGTLRFLPELSSSAGIKDGQVDEVKRSALHAIDLANGSKKFILPKGGMLFDDDECRALDGSDRLSLPFDFVALEFEAADDELKLAWSSIPEFTSRKRIIFARHVEELIVCTMAACFELTDRWATYNEFAIQRVGAIGEVIQHRRTVNLLTSKPGEAEFDGSSNCADILIGFLNALACSNVKIDRSPAKKEGKKIKSALPFDAYHILTIDIGKNGDDIQGIGGAHRSPREHLRRGHVRRLMDGRRIWVNAAVVGARKGAGVITKDYKIKTRASA